MITTILKHTIVDTSMSWIAVVATETGLRRISIHSSFDDATRNLVTNYPDSTNHPDDFIDLAERLKRYTLGERATFNDKLDLGQATPFQRAVWDATREIPYGETRSYEWIACRIGKPGAARAVGQALKRNPLPLIVPCHRVIGKSGGLTGFSCGLDVKRQLIALEFADGLI